MASAGLCSHACFSARPRPLRSRWRYATSSRVQRGDLPRDLERRVRRRVVGDDDAPAVRRQMLAAPGTQRLDARGQRALLVVAGDDEIDGFHVGCRVSFVVHSSQFTVRRSPMRRGDTAVAGGARPHGLKRARATELARLIEDRRNTNAERAPQRAPSLNYEL